MSETIVKNIYKEDKQERKEEEKVASFGSSSSSLINPFNSIHTFQMEREVIESELILPTQFRFKKIQMHEKYQKGQARSRQWKHLKQIIPAENYQNYAPHQPNCKYL
uniref:Chromatin-remodeling complex subunit ies6 n=1 Tax=Tanacetum cinerariifolium TaxID=118510 RepID=A0A6L2JT50_TANCI|nr:chromatin-remodeling complex subunit ies6 [Tanacetum cinerariifolium]